MQKGASDIPESGRANEVQALAEAVLEAACAAGLGVTVSFDAGDTLRFIFANDAVAAILGRSIDELIGSETALVFAKDERERIQHLAIQWRQGVEASRVVETVIVRPGGETIPVELVFSVVTLGGEPAIVKFVRDIRERRQVESIIKDSERRFRQLIEAAPDAIGVYREGRLVYVNPALVVLLGRTSDDLTGRDFTEFVHADDRELLTRQRAAQGAESPKRHAQEYRVLHASGRLVTVETVSIPIEYEGRPASLGFSRDTTERKLLQAHLAFSDRMATLGMLAASVAHEINNPLTYATLNFETLSRQVQSYAPPAAATELGAIIAGGRDGLTRVATIVRDLKELSTPKSVERWPVDVKTVLESALNVAMHAIRGRAQIVRDYDEVSFLRTDPTRLGQIFLNLVFNAAQSFETSDEATNVIGLRIASAETGNVVVTISDSGPGIAREHLERIFEPFFTTKRSGMGLGLAICQSLTTSLGGRLVVESELGQGAKFTLELPVPHCQP